VSCQNKFNFRHKPHTQQYKLLLQLLYEHPFCAAYGPVCCIPELWGLYGGIQMLRAPECGHWRVGSLDDLGNLQIVCLWAWTWACARVPIACSSVKLPPQFVYRAWAWIEPWTDTMTQAAAHEAGDGDYYLFLCISWALGSVREIATLLLRSFGHK